MPGDYNPNAVNCSYCVRLNCPARLGMLGSLVTQWTGKPVAATSPQPSRSHYPSIGLFKEALQRFHEAFTTAVDEEAKRRAFSGDIIEGYEIAEKSSARTVTGAINITQANKVIVSEWNELEFADYNWGDYFLKNVELSIADLEKEIG